MRTISAFFVAMMASACSFEADGHIKPGYPEEEHAGSGHIVDSNYNENNSGYGSPMIIDTFAECWRIQSDANYSATGKYAWFLQADIEHSSGYMDMIDSVWIDIYDDYGLAYTIEMSDDALYSEWIWPEWVGPEGLSTVPLDGVWMAAFQEQEPLRCGSQMGYEIYTTVYDEYGTYVTAVDYL